MLRTDFALVSCEPVPLFGVIIGICAYNEEGNIELLLRNLLSEQNLPEKHKILVICSGCTDTTPQIVKKFQEKDARIELLNENTRKGKSNALNKIFSIARAHSDILILVNADALPEKDSINKLVSKLETSHAGAVFGQPVPLKNSRATCYGISRVIWRLHHIISLNETPKLSGELCAINAFCLEQIPENIATDEPYIERAIRRQHKHVLYVPGALVYIRCPTNILDLVKQRKRIWIGHIQLKSSTGYKVSTSSFRKILKAIPALRPRDVPYILLGGFMEIIAYLEAQIAFNKGTIPYAWEPIRSTKIVKMTNAKNSCSRRTAQT